MRLRNSQPARSNTTGPFYRRLMQWYRDNKRSLPWRQTRNPYHILVSEIMLQQTQVSRVRKKYPLFLKRFPTVKKLAEAAPAEVIRAWQGMGYNLRALRLRESARVVVQRFDGKIPNDLDALLTLPGVGKYTAHATACFAFKRRVPVVDVNIRRVLSRIFWRMNDAASMKDEPTIWDLATSLLPKRAVSDWHQALMDFGATICVSRDPQCATCPMSTLCSSYQTLSSTRVRRRKRNTERPYGGLPVRIYRGRIIEHLRRFNGRSRITVENLGPLIKPNFSRKDKTWLNRILHKLQADGLLRLQHHRNRWFVHLPQA